MTKFGRSLIAAIVAAGTSLFLVVGSSAIAADAHALWQFEAEPAASLKPQPGTVIGSKGIGPIQLDIVRTTDSGVVDVVRQSGTRPPTWPRPLLLVGGQGAYYAAEPAPQGTWVPFASAAALGFLAAALGAWFAVTTLRRNADRIAFVLFGQRAPGTRSIGWLPGNGGHGGNGGQVPPFVPHDVEWEPSRRSADMDHLPRIAV